jgi:hypothetical protein
MPTRNQDSVRYRNNPQQRNQTSRREFLVKLGALPVAAMAAEGVSFARSGGTVLPHIKFGKVSISRLVCGANPFNAGSHLSVFVNHEMQRYYTQEQVLKTLRRCQEVGINCWQSGSDKYETYRRFIDQGGMMHYLSINSDPDEIEPIAKAGGLGIAHHGETTDNMFKAGKLDKVNDYLKRVHDAGLMAGVSTHMPVVIEAIEDKGWGVDYYMACVYERHRSADALKKMLGQMPIPVGEVYLQEDPPRMFKAMRQTKRPCLAFKILAAGRLSERREWVEKAFRETFKSIKPNDGVIIGIYDRYSDQPAEDADYTRRFSSLSGSV